MAAKKNAKKKSYGPSASKIVKKVMHERKHGTLKSGGSKKTSRKQAVAIALSEARAAGAKVPKAPRKKVSRKKARKAG